MAEIARNRREVLRDAFAMRERIEALLSEGPMTIPSLAQALQAPSQDVVIWLMAMLRYGQVAPAGKADAEGYYPYGLSG
jgi:hypothetical protein